MENTEITSRLLFFFITNHPEIIDNSFLTRCIKVIRFLLPTTEEKFNFFNDFLQSRGYQNEIKNNDFWIKNTKFLTFRETTLLARICIQNSSSLNSTITVNDMKSAIYHIHPTSDVKTESTLDRFSAMVKNDVPVQSTKYILPSSLLVIIFCGFLSVFFTVAQMYNYETEG